MDLQYRIWRKYRIYEENTGCKVQSNYFNSGLNWLKNSYKNKKGTRVKTTQFFVLRWILTVRPTSYPEFFSNLIINC